MWIKYLVYTHLRLTGGACICLFNFPCKANSSPLVCFQTSHLLSFFSSFFYATKRRVSRRLPANGTRVYFSFAGALCWNRTDTRERPGYIKYHIPDKVPSFIGLGFIRISKWNEVAGKCVECRLSWDLGFMKSSLSRYRSHIQRPHTKPHNI